VLCLFGLGTAGAVRAWRRRRRTDDCAGPVQAWRSGI
jgi:hypothetical protein